MKKMLWLCCLLVLASAVALAQDMSVVTPTDQKFGPLPNFPDCAKGAVVHGDPGSEQGVIVVAKATAGCKIPWHWHTPNEQLGIVSGTTTLQAKGESAPKTLTAGAYAFLPSKHQHEFVCKTACTLFVAADNKFDIHYVDASGNEIPSDQALKGAKKAGGAAKGGEKKAPPKM